MRNEERPITLILDCPITGKTIVTHMREDQLDMFMDSCAKEIKRGLDELVRESEKPKPEAEIASEEERYFYG